jgi:hypothetical protein
VAPPIDELLGGRAAPWQRADFGDLGPIAGDRHGFTAGDPIQDVTSVIT